MATIVKSTGVALALLTLGACSKLGMGQDEMAWARAALERNDRIEVVASDPQAKTFTVRMKDSGKLTVVSIDQIVAGPQPPTRTDTVGKSSGAVGGAGMPAAPGSEPVTEPASPDSIAQSAPASTPPEQAAPQTRSPEPDSTALASAGESGHAGDGQGPHAHSAANAREGSVLASGPGYSIKASGPRGSTSRPALLTAARGTPVERLHDPIICQGSRLLHIDNRNLEFEGNAVSAEDGCEIHITNTHISAKGIGVLARAANVHIENSEIEGDSGAIDASDGAQVYAESSRFKGLTRHLESSAFHDLGGNVWN